MVKTQPDMFIPAVSSFRTLNSEIGSLKLRDRRIEALTLRE